MAALAQQALTGRIWISRLICLSFCAGRALANPAVTQWTLACARPLCGPASDNLSLGAARGPAHSGPAEAPGGGSVCHRASRGREHNENQMRKLVALIISFDYLHISRARTLALGSASGFDASATLQTGPR